MGAVLPTLRGAVASAKGAAMVRDLLAAANDVAWTLIDSGVVDEKWDLFNLFKEHRIKIIAADDDDDATGMYDHPFAPCARYRPTKAKTSSSTRSRSRRTRVAHTFWLAQR